VNPVPPLLNVLSIVPSVFNLWIYFNVDVVVPVVPEELND